MGLYQGVEFGLQSDTVPLDPSGTVVLPITITFAVAEASIESNLASFSTSVDPISDVSLSAGYYHAGTLSLPFGGSFDVPVPFTANGVSLIARFDVLGSIVATAIPEPTSFTLMGLGLTVLGMYGYRRRTRVAPTT